MFGSGKRQRWVVKVGSGVLAADDGQIRLETLTSIASDVARLRSEGVETILVSSGAVASGFRQLGYNAPPNNIRERQACASVGQVALVRAYDEVFRCAVPGYAAVAGLVLLTHEDFSNRQRYLHGRHTIETLLERGAIPVINENDTVAVEEILLGDNDRLGAMVAAMVDADFYIILTNVDGFLRQHADGSLGDVVAKIAESDLDRYLSDVGPAKSTLGRGGMRSKLEAAKAATSFGVPTFITSGKRTAILQALKNGQMPVGTLVEPSAVPLDSRRYWIRFVTKPKGKLQIDAGAERALCEHGKSLLPKGIVAVTGKFEAGDPVEVLGSNGRVLARGLVEYGSQELQLIKGKHSSQFAAILGYKRADEAIHRNDLALESSLATT